MSSRIGLIVPCDLTLDREYWALVPADVTVHVTRTGFHEGELDLEFVRGVSDRQEIAYAARSLSKIRPDVTAFACTSGSFVDGIAGELEIRQTMLAAGARAAVTTSGALVEALGELGVHRVALATPYADEIAEHLPPFLAEAGFSAVSLANLALPDVIDDIASQAVVRLAEAAMRPEAEALFLACTGVPTIQLLGELQRRWRVPVLSANQVTIWAALRAAGHTVGEPASLLTRAA